MRTVRDCKTRIIIYPCDTQDTDCAVVTIPTVFLSNMRRLLAYARRSINYEVHRSDDDYYVCYNNDDSEFKEQLTIVDGVEYSLMQSCDITSKLDELVDAITLCCSGAQGGANGAIGRVISGGAATWAIPAEKPDWDIEELPEVDEERCEYANIVYLLTYTLLKAMISVGDVAIDVMLGTIASIIGVASGGTLAWWAALLWVIAQGIQEVWYNEAAQTTIDTYQGLQQDLVCAIYNEENRAQAIAGCRSIVNDAYPGAGYALTRLMMQALFDGLIFETAERAIEGDKVGWLAAQANGWWSAVDCDCLEQQCEYNWNFADGDNGFEGEFTVDNGRLVIAPWAVAYRRVNITDCKALRICKPHGTFGVLAFAYDAQNNETALNLNLAGLVCCALPADTVRVSFRGGAFGWNTSDLVIEEV